MHRQEVWIPQAKAAITDTRSVMSMYQAMMAREEKAQERYETRTILDPMLSVADINWQEVTSQQYWEKEEQKAIARLARIEHLKSLLDRLQAELEHHYATIEGAVLDVLLFGPVQKIPVALSLLHWCDWSSPERRASGRQFGLPFSDSPTDARQTFSLADHDLRQAVRLRLLRLQPVEKARDLLADAHHNKLWHAVDYYTALFIDVFARCQIVL